MSQERVHVEIQKVLASINDITLKIGKELQAINELSSENGSLNTAIENANVTLKNDIRNSGIMVPPSDVDDDDDGESENFMIPEPLSDITGKLNALMRNSES